ncbi:MAG: hypothetical protein U0168_17585 [Nannocystaceae bacterium]
MALGATLVTVAASGVPGTSASATDTPELALEVDTGEGMAAMAASESSGGIVDPRPNEGDTRKCFVGWITTSRSGSSCTVTLSAKVAMQTSVCTNPPNPYPNPNPTTQAFLDGGLKLETPGCSVTSATKGKDTVISCNPCPSEITMTVNADGGRRVTLPLP